MRRVARAFVAKVCGGVARWVVVEIVDGDGGRLAAAGEAGRKAHASSRLLARVRGNGGK